jgi:hypothetical protein
MQMDMLFEPPKNGNVFTPFTPSRDMQRCPTCARSVKVYKKIIHYSLALEMIYIVKLYAITNDWVRVIDVKRKVGDRHPAVNVGGGDLAKLRYWGLTFPCPNDNPKKRCSGLWKPTQDGIDFVNRKHKVNKYAVTYNAEVLKLEGQLVDIVGCLKDKFDYYELMAR